METVLTRPAPKTKGCKPGVARARLAYLHGEGDGVPVVSTRRLAEIASVHENTIKKWLPVWCAEMDEMISKTSKLETLKPLSVGPLSIPPETLQISKDQTDFLLKRLTDIQSEIENIDKTVYKLENILEKFEDNEKDFLIKGFEAYLRFSANKQSLTKQYLAVHTRWTAVSGVDSVREIQVAGAKAVSVAQARAGSNDSEEKDSEELVVGFKKRG